jgi:hypothetical protein
VWARVCLTPGKGAERLVLEPLDEAAVAHVARDVMQAEPDETLLRMAGEAGGNPFLLVELLEGLPLAAALQPDFSEKEIARSSHASRVGLTAEDDGPLTHRLGRVGGALGVVGPREGGAKQPRGHTTAAACGRRGCAPPGPKVSSYSPHSRSFASPRDHVSVRCVVTRTSRSCSETMGVAARPEQGDIACH